MTSDTGGASGPELVRRARTSPATDIPGLDDEHRRAVVDIDKTQQVHAFDEMPSAAGGLGELRLDCH